MSGEDGWLRIKRNIKHSKGPDIDPNKSQVGTEPASGNQLIVAENFANVQNPEWRARPLRHTPDKSAAATVTHTS